MVRLHPKFGLNPTMAKCILCGEQTGEIALLGNACKTEAPHESVVSVEPCQACREKYLSVGVMLVDTDANRKPTGDVVVITDDSFRRIFSNVVSGRKDSAPGARSVRPNTPGGQVGKK